MRFFYGNKNSLRVLDEMEFWKRQEAEHTVVMRTIMPELEKDYVKYLENFEGRFTQTEGDAIKYIETVTRAAGNISPQLLESILCLIEYAMKESECFLQLIDDILANSKAAKDPIARTVVKHIRRESEYFIGISQTILYESNRR